MTDLISRATQAFLRAQDNSEQPSRSDSSVESHGGTSSLVVLRNARGVLAVYSLDKHDRLRRLDPSRWPAGLTE